MASIFGADALSTEAPRAGSYVGGGPDLPSARRVRPKSEPDSPMTTWCRNAAATLKRERQAVTEEMKRNTAMARGATPWWRGRPEWKISTKLNFAFTVPATWTAILCDAKPTVTYSALDRSKQRRADIATAAFDQASVAGAWDQKVHDAVLVSRVQKKAYLSLRPKLAGDTITPDLRVFLGEQVYVDQNATCIRDAEIALAEYRESYGSLCERFPGLRRKLRRKYEGPKGQGAENSVLSPPASYSFPKSSQTQPGGSTYNAPSVTTPAYAGSASPPDGAAGSSGLKVQEFWTRPHKTTEVDEVQFLASGVPATRPKMYDTIDPDDEEPLRRIVTDGDVIYELPESLVNALYDAMGNGGLQIVEDHEALEAVTHPVRYPLYPHGRLVVMVDDDVEADDRMNPLGYIPLVEISANSDPGGAFYGPSDVDIIADVYEQLVRMVSLVHDNAQMTSNGLWRVWDGTALTNDDFTNAPGGILREELMSLKNSRREKGQDLPNYILAHIKFLVDQIKELSGLTDMMTGKMPPKQQISTETATMHQEASGVRFRDSLASLSRALQELGEQFLEFMARFYTTPVIVQIKNDAGVPEPTPMLGAYLTDPFIVEAKAGSRQAAGPTQRLTTLLNIKNAGVPVDLEMVYDLLEELGAVPSATAAVRRIEKLRSDPMQRWKLLLPPEPKAKGHQQSKKPGSKRAGRQGAAAG